MSAWVATEPSRWAIPLALTLAVPQALTLLLGARQLSPTAAVAIAPALDTLNHELRTPLNAIIGFASLLRSLPTGTTEPARMRDYARIIEVSGEHILAVLEEATGAPTDHQRVCSPGPANLADTLRTAIEMLAASAAERSISLCLVAPNLPVVAGVDRRALLQILINLITNAVKFSPSGGEVRLEITTGRHGIDICVRDHGFGMEPGDLAGIGRPFTRGGEALRRRIDGSGLGLSISRRLVQEMGGSLSFESAPGAGTTARLQLPLNGLAPGLNCPAEAGEPISHLA